MSPTDHAQADRETRLNHILADYFDAVERGERSDPESMLIRHPDLAVELKAFFTEQEQVFGLAGPLRALLRAEPAAEGGISSAAPRSFGDYEVLEEMARGGMGVVYRARQKSLNRLVALKVIRAGEWATAEEVRRFRNEAETVALLDHPHVVPVHEVGEQAGQLYFSMKLVQGGSLAEHLDRYRNDPKAAADLLATVARAVHHAHQRGVLHRDLKPSNILLDEDGRPHVTDFGLARRVAVDSSLTQSGAIIGTPSYIAPEQTSGRKGLVTTATDVHGLGAVLYALLTGRPPFVGETVLETMEQVKNCEPETPRRINPKVDRDLETICWKCLHKEPQRRYESAQGLAEDLERWLKGEPIWARRSNSWERFWKWVRRRPTTAALIAVLVLAAVGLVVGLLWHNDQLQQAAEREKAEAGHARRGRKLARKVVDRMYTQVATQWLEDEPQLTDLQRSFLEEALHFYQELSEETDDPSVRQETARAYRYMGDICTKLGRRAEGNRAYNQAIARLTELLDEQPDDPSMSHELAMTYKALGSLMHKANRPTESEKNWRLGLAIAEKLVQDHPNEADYQHALGVLCLNLSSPYFAPPEPEKFLHRAREIHEKLLVGSPNNAKYQATLGNIFNNLAIWRMMQSKPGEARQLLEKAIEHNREALKINPRLKTALGSLRSNYSILGGDVLPALGLNEDALNAAQEARAVSQRLIVEFPAVPAYKRQEADSQADVGRALRKLGRLREAEEVLCQARNLWEKVIAQEPDIPALHSLLAETCRSLAEVLEERGRDKEAIAQYRRALELDPKNAGCKTNLAWALVVLGGETRQHATEAVTLARQATQEKPLAWQSWNALGGALYRAEQWKESIEALEKGMQLNKGSGQPAPHLFWAMVQCRLGNKKEAKERYRQVSRLMAKNANWTTEWKRVHAEATALLGVTEQHTKDKEVSPAKK